MLIRIISLVILLNISTVGVIFSAENNGFIYPKKKPSIFKKTITKEKLLKSSSIIPQKKPETKKKKKKKAKN